MFTKKIAGCIIIEKNKVLLIRKKSNNWFEIPGGTIEAHETPQQTAIREMKEETCCDVEILSLYQEQEFEHKGKLYHGTWFLGKISSKPEPKIGEPQEYSEIAFIPLEQLSEMAISPTVQNILLSIPASSQ
ncbi:NUDIX hydrolase [Candidatus Woesearchaeota archaeon]|nr:NUDIX hydrolase [Candidatus Woesearchaeota archaeon]